MSDQYGFDQNLALLNMEDVTFVESIGAGYAEVVTEDGTQLPDAPDRIFMLTVEYSDPDELEDMGTKAPRRQMFLALSPPALDDLIQTLARVLMVGDEPL